MKNINFTCPFCSLLCDDIQLTVKNKNFKQLNSNCSILSHSLKEKIKDQFARINGKKTNITKAINNLSSLLKKSKSTLFTGMGTDIKGTKATLKIADKFKCIIDHFSGDSYVKNIKDIKNLPKLIKQTLSKQGEIQSIARDFVNSKGTMFLGRGHSFPIAMEGALKLKELSYIHAEGYPAGEMKHGPLALIEDGMPVVVLAPKDRYFEKTISNMQEVIARGGKVLLITDDDSNIISENIRFKFQIPKINNHLNSFLMTIPLQLLAYHVALLKNYDIDKPRNLAKSVTVE